MTPAAFRELALSFPGAHEAPHFERTSFRVGKKIFATMKRDGGEAMVRVPDPDDVEALLSAHPGVFFGYGKWTSRMGALGVRLAKAEPALMAPLVSGAWRSVAPKKAIAELEGRGRPRRGRG